MQTEALLTCSCGMWGLGVNDCLEQGVGFSWALLQNEWHQVCLFLLNYQDDARSNKHKIKKTVYPQNIFTSMCSV